MDLILIKTEDITSSQRGPRCLDADDSTPAGLACIFSYIVNQNKSGMHCNMPKDDSLIEIIILEER